MAELTQPLDISANRTLRVLRIVGWVLFGLFCLTVFTLIKLPEDRLKNYIQGQISNALSPRGISLSAAKSGLSVGFGISYTMKDVTINLPPPEPAAHVDEIVVTPSLLSFAFGKLAGKVGIQQGDGLLTASFSTNQVNTSVDFDIKNLDLGKIGLLPMLAGIKGSGLATGKGSIDGNFSVPSTLTGDIKINLSKIILEQQSISGFSIPKLNISEAVIELKAEKAKASVKTLRLGKSGNAADDIQASVTGEMALGKQWESSTLNLKTKFSFSQNVMKSFALLDAILGAGKQADGGYAYTLTGPVMTPIPTPGGG